MSFPSKVDTVYANVMSCTPVDSANFNIVNTNGGEILLNGVAPGGGGGSLPIIGTGDITVTGNIRAQGDGVTTGKLEGEIIKATTGNIIATAGNVEVLAGNVEISGTGGLEINGSGTIKATSGNVEVLAGNVEISGAGSLQVKGTGEIKTEGGGNITAGLSGDVQTTAGDIVSGNKIFFDGDDIYHRTNNPAAETSYVVYKQLPQLGANNTFTGANKFDDNVNEFSEKVSVGTRDIAGLFTQKTAINPSGNIECVSMNNGTAITTGTINCDNGGTNSCAAKLFTTRTSGTAGWTIEQQEVGDGPSGLDNVLQMKGGQPGAYVSIVDSAFSGFVSTIILAPQTEALGGLIQTDNFRVGDGGANSFNLIQPKTGSDAQNLLIKSGASGGPIKFQNNAGNIDLVRIEPDSTNGSGRIYCPAIFFGTTGIHNSIVNDVSGAGNLNLKIRQATASSEVLFLDNTDSEIIRIQKTQVEFGQNIPILFNNFSFRPQQYTFNFTGATIDDNPTVLFNSHSTLWTNVNDGGTSTLNTIGNNFFKMTIIGVPTNSAGVYGNFRWSGDFPFLNPAFSVGTVINRYDGNFSIIKSPVGFTKPDVCGFSSTTTDYKLCFPSVASGTDTYSGTIRITILNT